MYYITYTDWASLGSVESWKLVNNFCSRQGHKLIACTGTMAQETERRPNTYHLFWRESQKDLLHWMWGQRKEWHQEGILELWRERGGRMVLESGMLGGEAELSKETSSVPFWLSQLWSESWVHIFSKHRSWELWGRSIYGDKTLKMINLLMIFETTCLSDTC